MVRTAMLEELGQDYIRTARAKGLQIRCCMRHALPNALVPIVTVVDCSSARCSRAIVTEKIFTGPARQARRHAISNRDYALCRACSRSD